MLSHVEEVGKAALPDQAELDTLRGNVAKQQQKVDQLSTPQPSANGVQVLFVPPVPHASYCLNLLFLANSPTSTAGDTDMHAATVHWHCSAAKAL